MKITKEWMKEWLADNGACSDGVKWYDENNLTDVEHTKLVNMLVDDGRFNWTFSIISKLLDLRRNTMWACNSARLVLPIFEAEKPGDNSARKCIECAENPASTYDELCAAIGEVNPPAKDVARYAAGIAIRSAAMSDFRYAAGADAISVAMSAFRSGFRSGFRCGFKKDAKSVDISNARYTYKHKDRSAAMSAAMSASRYSAISYTRSANSDADIDTKIIDFGLKLIKEQENENN